MKIDSIRSFIFKKKYQSRIVLFIMVSVFILMTIFSYILYFSVEKIVLSNDYSSNKKLLHQMKYNIEYLDEVIRNLSLSIYLNKDVKTLIMQKEIGLYELFTSRYNIIANIVNTNPFIHSVSIYNGSNRTCYTTDTTTLFEDPSIEDFLRSHEDLPQLKPITRRVRRMDADSENETEVVFSYFLYQSPDGNKTFNSAVIINVKLDWILNNINMLNKDDNNRNNAIYVIDSQGAFLPENPENPELKLGAARFYQNNLQKLNSSQDRVDFLVQKIDSKEYVITFIKLASPGWVIIKLQPYEEVFQHIGNLKNTVIIITAVFLLIAVVLSVSVSKSIYQPIAKLMSKIRPEEKGKPDANVNDEVSYIHNLIVNNEKKLNLFIKEKISNNQLLKTYYLRKLIADSSSFDREELERLNSEFNVSLDFNRQMAVCVVKIDNYKDFTARYDSKDQELMKFAVANILGEVLSTRYANEVIDMRQSELAAVFNINGIKRDFTEDILKCLEQARENIDRYLAVSVSFSLSDAAREVREITKQYNLALNNSLYRYVYGRYSIVTNLRLNSRDKVKGLESIIALEKKMIEEIKCGSLENASDILLKMLCDMCRLDYNNILMAQLRLINAVKVMLDEVDQNSLKPVYIDINSINQQVYEMETIDDFYYLIINTLKEIMSKRESSVDEKHAIVVETIKSIIHTNYHKSELCLQQIASMLKMSSAIVGKLFKDNTMKSVPEYINEVRLEHSLELLNETNLSVQQIMYRVGMENESYFYKLFKKKFGTTPKEYVLKRSVGRF